MVRVLRLRSRSWILERFDVVGASLLLLRNFKSNVYGKGIGKRKPRYGRIAQIKGRRS